MNHDTYDFGHNTYQFGHASQVLCEYPWAYEMCTSAFHAFAFFQVVVRVNDIPAYCSGSCAFRYLDRSTPQVHSVWCALGMM